MIRGMLTELRVELGERSYPIRFGTGLAPKVGDQVAAWRAQGRKVAVIADETVAKLHGVWLAAAFTECPLMTVPAGEGSKTVAVLGQVLEFLATQRLDRGSVVAAVVPSPARRPDDTTLPPARGHRQGLPSARDMDQPPSQTIAPQRL